MMNGWKGLNDLRLWFACMAVPIGLSLLVACSPRADTAVAEPGGTAKSEGISVTVDSVSYRHDRSMEYTLYDLRKEPPQAVGGGIVDRLASGGDKGCCLNLPLQWRPGMKVRVAWEEGDRERMYPEKHVRDLEIPRYDSPADLVVVFYAGHEVEVIVSAAEVGHPQWKGRIKKTPWDACVEEIGQKACKATIPNYGGYSIDELRGVCHTDIVTEELCARFIARCNKDFEDLEMCQALVWEQVK